MCELAELKRSRKVDAITNPLPGINLNSFGHLTACKMAPDNQTRLCNQYAVSVDSRINAERTESLKMKKCNCACSTAKPTRRPKSVLQAVSLLLILSNWSTVSATTTVGNPPRVLKNDVTSVIAFKGETLTLPCMVMSGKPRPRTQWYKDGVEIGKDWERFKQQRKGLRIRNVALEDRGVYRCEAVNGYGSEELEIMLLVKVKLNTTTDQIESEKPIFTEPIKMRRYNIAKPIGRDVRFSCKAKGKPPPQIQWFKDGNFTSSPDGNPRRQQWTLTLRQLKLTDSGRYTCRVWNKAGAISFNYSLRVEGLFQLNPVLVKPHPVNTTVRVGEKTSLQCRVRSNIVLTVKWMKQIEPSAQYQYSERLLNNSLRIDGNLYVILPTQETLYLPEERTYLNKHVIVRATEHDAGRYLCVAANTRGYRLRGAYLSVLPARAKKQDEPPIRSTAKLNTIPLALIIGLPAAAGVVIVCVVTAFCINKRQDLVKFAGAVTKSSKSVVQGVYDVPSASSAEYVAPVITSRDDCTEHLCCHKQITTARVERVPDSDDTNTPWQSAIRRAPPPGTTVPAKTGRVTFDTSSKDDDDDHSSSYCFHEFNIHPPPPSLCSRSTVTETSANSRQRHKPGCRRNHNRRYHAYHRQSRRYDPHEKFSSPSYCS
uniref:fibroblast growth factor receptor-like 1 isoform X2 n=1 Tax=Ciona intestinalis TaxID=7719 RepID=UPI000EF4BABF|nr:fibroblast growth factor receptor-like 1 isoform X2 [Ciona intestinalis]|eukprot:XP_026690297.1 fibroblast growth factor receptor-like 1 isoform X2 [Ciona intestinalis]